MAQFRRSLRTVLGVALTLLAAPGLAQEDPHNWGYEGQHGPAHWAELDEAYRLCAEGEAQSPVDLSGATVLDLSDIQFDYGETPLAVTNAGHTIQVNVEPGSSIRYNARRYDLLQFHFHAPSEHTVDGEAAAMEAHFVHRAENGDLAVVGILLVVGDSDTPFSPILDHLPPTHGETIETGHTIILDTLIPAERTFITYGGSLTTPPCSEGVRWLVLDTPMTLTGAQVEAFIALIDPNARPVQPLNDRDLLRDSQ